MDKPRWLLTWYLAAVATYITRNDSCLWTFLKLAPLCIAAIAIEKLRSKWQNEKEMKDECDL